MTKIGKLWTGAVAYVSLLVGAGLSVAGNLADTYRTRGNGVDALDKVMAAGWPILVLLAIEMFVSPRWSSARMFQAWRWLGCLAVGGMAMVVSWTHLHDLMSSRGQLPVVSVLGPLAIDGMAIMATGLILSTRTRVPVSVTDIEARHLDSLMDVDTTVYAYESTPPTSLADVSSADMDAAIRGVLGNFPSEEVMATRPDGDFDAWEQGYEDALSTSGAQLADEVERYVQTALPRRTRTPSGMSCPAEFRELHAAWSLAGQPVPAVEVVKLSAAWFEVSERTVRRWLTACSAAL